MKRAAFALAVLTALAGSAGVAQSRKALVLPSAATDVKSTANRVATMMIVVEEQGVLPPEAKGKCANDETAGSYAGNVTLHLEHYLTDAKMIFEMKVSASRQSSLKQKATDEAQSAPVVTETTDGAEVAYYVTKAACDDAGKTSSTRIDMLARFADNMNYADIRIGMFAATPDGPRKLLREMLQKISTLDYNSIK